MKIISFLEKRLLSPPPLPPKQTFSVSLVLDSNSKECHRSVDTESRFMLLDNIYNETNKGGRLESDIGDAGRPEPGAGC